MTPQEAIKVLQFFKKSDRIKKFFKFLNKDAVGKIYALIDMCIELLEKQIPKAPKFIGYYGSFGAREYICPNGCEGFVYYVGTYPKEDDNYDLYCSCCGQRLDWFDESIYTDEVKSESSKGAKMREVEEC